MTHDPHTSLSPYAVWENAFTPPELDAIEALGDRLRLEKAVLVYGEGGSSTEDPARITRTAWLGREPQTDWLYARMEQAIADINAKVWRFDLSGFADNFQYTVYQGEEAGHFDWHTDQIRQPLHRKLSASLQLSDPGTYEGCDLEIQGGMNMSVMPRTRGALVVFPSYVLHRVTPIRSGTRKALVVWVGGPPFR